MPTPKLTGDISTEEEPDRGDERTRRLKEDADGDPMREQTEPATDRNGKPVRRGERLRSPTDVSETADTTEREIGDRTGPTRRAVPRQRGPSRQEGEFQGQTPRERVRDPTTQTLDRPAPTQVAGSGARSGPVSGGRPPESFAATTPAGTEDDGMVDGTTNTVATEDVADTTTTSTEVTTENMTGTGKGGPAGTARGSGGGPGGDGEQFGDIDWSFGFGGPEDEVEQFVDEKGKAASEWVGANISDPLRETGRDLKEGNRFIGEDVPESVGPGEAAGNILVGAGNLAEDLPRVPSAALEGVEGLAYLGGSKEAKQLTQDPTQAVLTSASGLGLTPQQEAGERAKRTATFGRAVAREEAKRIKAEPGVAAGEAFTGFLTGTVALRAVEKGADVARSARIARAADRPEVSLEDITTKEAARTGELPQFQASPGASTAKAVAEVRKRAAGKPPEAVPGEGERVLFHSTQNRLSGEVEVEAGGSELPGLFTSPEASPLRLSVRSRASSGRPRFTPRVRKSDQLVNVPGDDIRGMPERATGAGRVKVGDEWQPDPTTSGARFLTEEADPGAAYVRPRGSRTTELEAIVPPGSRFVEEGVTPVRVGGRTVPGTSIRVPGTGRLVPSRRFRRADVDVDADADDLARAGRTPDADADADGDVVVRTRDLPESRLRSSGGPVSPPVGVPSVSVSTAGSPTGTVTGTTGGGDSTTPTEPPTDITPTGGDTTLGEPTGRPPTKPPSSPPPGISSPPPTSRPPSRGGDPFGGGSSTGPTPTPPELGGGRQRRRDDEDTPDDEALLTDIAGWARRQTTRLINPFTGR